MICIRGVGRVSDEATCMKPVPWRAWEINSTLAKTRWGAFLDLLPLSHIIHIAAVDVLVHFPLQLVPSFGYRSCVPLKALSCFRGRLAYRHRTFLVEPRCIGSDMGNSQSSEDPKSPAVNDKAAPRRKDGERERSKVRGPDGSQSVRMKPQSHVTTARTTQAPPTTVLVPSSSTVSTSTSNAQAQANISASPASSHSRARSITTGTPKVRADDSVSRSPMGNAESRQQRPPSRSSTLPPLVTSKPSPSHSSQPVDVPHPLSHNDGLDDLDEPPMNSPIYGLPASDFSRPPRLPLPIERDPEPTSPIITPKDAQTPVDPLDEDELVPRRASMLSSTTLDDEEVADIETFELESDPFAQKVLTTIQYRGDAKTVFVTGTFARWEKKFRMQKGQDKDGKPLFTLTASLPAGTHHIRFLVDGEMIVTNQYLQTVDFTNSLVNYIEIAAQKPPAEEAHVTVPAEPIPIPGAQDVVVESEWTKPVDERSYEQAPETRDDVSSTRDDSSSQATTVQDRPSQAIPIRQTQQQSQQQRQQQQSPSEAKPKKYLKRPKYTNEIPELLVHIDYYNEPDKEYDHRRALKAAENLPQPPSLPTFMSKSILNATTPHKDDASVLTMPNHTVLNHLATSSIKSGVLATSGTTRYKKKVSRPNSTD